MRYFGSAMRMPHVQGAFRQQLVVNAAQAFPLADGISDAEGSMAEPLAVALHARATLRPPPWLFGAWLLGVFVLAFLTFFGVPFLSTAPHKGAI